MQTAEVMTLQAAKEEQIHLTNNEDILKCMKQT